MTIDNNNLIRACQDCDLLQTIPVLQEGETARCIRCHSILDKRRKNSLDRSLALALTGLILFVLSNLYPLLSLKSQGLAQEGTLFSASISLFENGRPLLAILVFFTTIAFPLFSLLGMIYMLASVKFHRKGRLVSPVFRFLHSTEIWGMLEVFLLAIMVAGVKLGDLAEVIPGISLYSFILLVLTLAALSLSLNPNDIWHQEQGCYEDRN